MCARTRIGTDPWAVRKQPGSSARSLGIRRGCIIPGRGDRHAEDRALIGIEFTTFSRIGRCERTGMFGIAIATSEMAVGSRCIHVAPGAGAVVTQASTNPRLG